MRRLGQIVLALAVLLPSWTTAAPAATLVPVGSFDQPIYVTSDPLDPDRLFVVEREGRVLVGGGGGFAPFADLEPLVSCCGGERGLLSIALAPDFPTSQRFYAVYTGTPAAGGAEGDIHVDAFRPAPGGGAPLRERVLTIGHSARENHNGGQLQLGPDGYLYLSTGDGGGVGDPDENGQDLGSLLGKVLRIDPRPGAEPGYVVPADNPFVGVSGADEIWSYGLRNPWRFSFDRLSGDLVIADVGQEVREEVDLGVSPAPEAVGGAGANYGWNCREGSIEYDDAPVSCEGRSGFTEPVFDYPHDDPGDGGAHGCSITGGYVVRDSGLPDLYGRYLYADFCVGELRSLVLSGPSAGPESDRPEGLTVANPVSFGEDSCGRIYVVSNGGGVFRLQGDFGPGCHSVPPPPAVPAATPVAGPPPLVILRARGGRGRTVRLIVRLLPCGTNGGAVVYLNRNGRAFRHKRLNRGCVARFRVRVGRPTRFRAFFEDQRSQVRTIAFAKPRP